MVEDWFVPSLPRATYRMQFHRGFTLRQATGLVPYLHQLGISHVYASPLLKARPGSLHGYDVCDCTQINPEIGTEAELEQFVAALRQRDMGLLLDTVPNHNGIGGRNNPWWWDVLQRGRGSRFADYFDIDWDSPVPGLRGKVLVPVLGEEYEQVLRDGQLKAVFENGEVTVRYFDHVFPVCPQSIAAPGKILDELVQELNGDGQALERFLDLQHYRLAFWRRGDTELNYRRFFNISTLAGVRVELPQVFTDTHNRLLDWRQRGLIDGFRIDHPDGLRDPRQYLERLKKAASRGIGVSPAPFSAPSPSVTADKVRTDPDAWLLVEKILEPGEALPSDWPVAGTTGYDFLNRAGGLFIDSSAEKALTGFYVEFTGEPADYEAIVLEKKRLALRQLLAAEVEHLLRLLRPLAAKSVRARAFSEEQLRQALVEMAACFKVYRSYVRAEAGQVSKEDIRRVREAAAKAKEQQAALGPARFKASVRHGVSPHFFRGEGREVAERGAGLTPAPLGRVFDFLAELLLLKSQRKAATDFVMRFQQLTGPAMAKGVEDTTFYCFNRFIALNEVGGDPGQFGLDPARFHSACQEAQAHWPEAMLATSTHDTKRSEDVRARLAVLSEMPEAWIAAVRRWSRMNEKHRRDGMPDRNIEYLFYQNVVGAWPIEVNRAVAFMEKASREARQHTSWTEPNPEYDATLKEFVIGALEDETFTDDLEAFVSRLLEAGQINSLAQTLLKLTAPGVPDVYQGAELWDLSLVDPDNRRPVDFATRRKLLGELASGSGLNISTGVEGEVAETNAGLTATQVWRRRNEGLPKLWVIEKTLGLRKRRPEWFGVDSSYTPLQAQGQAAGHVVAFARAGRVVTVVPRLTMRLRGVGVSPHFFRGEEGRSSEKRCGTDPDAREGNWGNTKLKLSPGTWLNELTGESVEGGARLIADLLRSFPVALLWRKETI